MTALICSIKASLRYRLDESHTFVLVVGKDTMTRRAGSCQYCFEANKCGNQTHKSYIEYECDKAANDGSEIIVLYNNTRIYRDRCPGVLRWKDTHVAMKTWNSLYGLTDWDYYAVKNAGDDIMYMAFNLKVSLENFPNHEELAQEGKERLGYLKNNTADVLKKYTMSDGTIDGTELSNEWFEKIASDVFISHSHNDEQLAFVVAGWLKSVFDLDVFLDECVWGSADGLLREIDNLKCKQSDGTYNYGKRNLTTSHVHAMLSTSIYTVMDNAEVILFLNTDQSVPKLDNIVKEDSDYTLSPWIYAEIMGTRFLRRRSWNEHRIQKAYEFAHRDDSIDIAYKLPLEHLTDLNVSDLINWRRSFTSGKKNKSVWDFVDGAANHPLNYLYDLKFEKQ